MNGPLTYHASRARIDEMLRYADERRRIRGAPVGRQTQGSRITRLTRAGVRDAARLLTGPDPGRRHAC